MNGVFAWRFCGLTAAAQMHDHEGVAATTQRTYAPPCRTRFWKDRIAISRGEIDEFCRRNHIHRLSFFGSVLRDDFRPESDVDLLVEFDPEHVPGYFKLSAMERELSGLMGRKVDLRTAGEISDYYRDRVFASSEVWYESP